MSRDLIPTIEEYQIGNRTVKRGFKGWNKGLSTTLPNMMFAISSSRKYGSVINKNKKSLTQKQSKIDELSRFKTSNVEELPLPLI